MTGAQAPRPRRVSLFIVATLGISALALLQTYLARWPGKSPLEHPMFDRLFAFTDNWGAALEVLVVLLVWALPPLRRAGARLAVAMGEHPGRTAAATFVILGLGARFAYHATPLAMDEYAQLAQAYAFAHGELSWIVPPELLDRMIPVPFRDYFFTTNPATGQVASQYWPGFAALLTPFAWAGLPWLLNPALSALCLMLIHAIAMRLPGGREAAGLALLFTLGSVQFTILGISYYSMPAHLMLNLLFAWLLLDATAPRAFLAGLAGGLALVLHNPLPHAIFALPWFLWLLADQRRWPALLALCVGYLPIGFGTGIGWPMFLASLNPHVATVASHPGIGTTLLRGYAQLTSVLAFPDFHMVTARLYASWKVWIWSAPGLLLLAIGGCRAVRGPMLMLAASAAATYLLYWLVPLDQGHGWGYRYFFTAWGALPIFGAAFLTAPVPGDGDGTTWRHWAGGFALASLVLATGLRLAQVDAVLREHLAQRIPVPDAGRWLVFMTPRRGLYSWDMIQNFPGDTHRIVLMSLGAHSDATLVASEFPQARRALLDDRGSLWSLPPLKN